MSPKVRGSIGQQDAIDTGASGPFRRSSRLTGKIQPGIREKAESHLVNAAPNVAPKAKSSRSEPDSNPRKRKLASRAEIAETSSAASSRIKKRMNLDIEHRGGIKPSVSSDNSKTKPKSEHKAEPAGPSSKKDGLKEKRSRPFRPRPPQTFLTKLDRARTQRMIVIGRTRKDTEAFPCEDVDIVGSTGNIYRVTIGQTPSCTCPDAKKGNECKHKVYVLRNVLRAPEQLQYQLAFLSSELGEIFANAPPIPTETNSSNDTDGNRKPTDGECPICYMDFDEGSNALVWCKAACGNNMHQSCFDQWAASQRGSTVKCVYCRIPWQTDTVDIQNVIQGRTVNPEGYVNVAEHFGMGVERDDSTYYRRRRAF